MRDPSGSALGIPWIDCPVFALTVSAVIALMQVTITSCPSVGFGGITIVNAAIELDAVVKIVRWTPSVSVSEPPVVMPLNW